MWYNITRCEERSRGADGEPKKIEKKSKNFLKTY